MLLIIGPSGPRSILLIESHAMNSETITSRDNSLLKTARAVRDGKIDELIFVEGLRLCEEALLSRLPLEAVIVSEELAQKTKAINLLETIASASVRIAIVSEALLSTVSYTKTPQGIVALASRPAIDEHKFAARLQPSPLLVVLHGINNPVNVGAIMRTAEAAGAAGIITTTHTSDAYSPKSLRGAMGSAFRLPVWSKVLYTKVIDWCREKAMSVVCADAAGEVIYSELDWTGACALVMGPE